MVADDVSGQSIESEVRTSSGMFLEKALDEVVADIEARTAAWTFHPVGLFAFDLDTALQTENGEALQILHYQHGQKYEQHFGYFYDKVNLERGGHRIATVLMYLSDVESSGKTVFPNSEGKLTQPKDDSWSDCAKTGYASIMISCARNPTLKPSVSNSTVSVVLAVKPRKADTLLFFNLHPDTTTDPKSLHGSCPVIKSEKWSATKWIHVQSFDNMESQTEDCVDKNGNCPFWAKAGECEKNPAYMVGSEEFTGYCRKSCK
ncbi:hypothetical protein Gorai_000199, partial [Gossypium raimondii]|nr:hypothetical protein [Gossypium raimondii]